MDNFIESLKAAGQMRAYEIEQQVKSGTYIKTVEPKRMSEVDKLCRDIKMIEVNAIRSEYND